MYNHICLEKSKEHIADSKVYCESVTAMSTAHIWSRRQEPYVIKIVQPYKEKKVEQYARAIGPRLSQARNINGLSGTKR